MSEHTSHPNDATNEDRLRLADLNGAVLTWEHPDGTVERVEFGTGSAQEDST